MESMEVDEGKEITPYWVTNDAEKRRIYTDHCMLKAVINWKLKLQDDKPQSYMGKKGIESMARQLEEQKISQIINKKDMKESYAIWSSKVIETAEKNKRKRKSNDWKSCRLLNRAKKHVTTCIKSERNKQKRESLKQRKEYIEEYIHAESQEKMRAKINRISDEIMKDGGVDGETFWKVRKRILGRKKEARYAIKDKDGVLKESAADIIKVYQEFYDDR